MVRSIVEQALAQKAAAGMSTKKSAGDLAAGVGAMQSGNYKAAYTYFRSAYQSVVN